MNPTGSGTVLRPLGIGEILDRAVNLCVRHFVNLGLIYLVFLIPLAVVQFLGSGDNAALMQTLTDALKPGHTGGNAELLRRLGQSNGSSVNPWTLLLFVIAIFVSPLPAAALIAAVAAVYLGRPTSFALAYRAGFARWGHFLGVLLMYFFAGSFLYLVTVIAIVAVFFAVVVLYSLQSTVGIVVGVVLGIAVLALVIGIATLATLAAQMSFLACVIERVNFVMAFTSGIRRVFAGIGVRRSLPVGLAFFAIQTGLALVALAGQVLLTGFLRSAVAGIAYAAIVAVITATFSTAFLVIFYYDLRVREEGLDLQILAQSVSLEPLPSP